MTLKQTFKAKVRLYYINCIAPAARLLLNGIGAKAIALTFPVFVTNNN